MLLRASLGTEDYGCIAGLLTEPVCTSCQPKLTKIEDRKEKIQVKAGLIDYIDKIRLIKKPGWVKQAGEAHDIRKKRNLVHAKLCLNDSAEINEETCRMVLRYLKDVMETRMSLHT